MRSGPARSDSWRWALVFVGAVHLLGAAGAPLIGDHLEMVAMVRRLLRTGSFTISDRSPLQPVVPRMALAPPGGEYRPRFFPGTPLAHAPLHLVDRLLGIDGAPHVGTLAHYTGHVCVLLALALVGRAIRVGGGSDQAAAAAILITGTSWPVWQIARHGGAEPVVALAMAVFLLAALQQRRGLCLATCALLPWLHPTGVIVAVALALSSALDPARPAAGAAATLRRAAPALAAAGFGAASVALLWNQLYLGSAVSGGYASSIEGALLSRPPLAVFFGEYLSQCALFAPVPVLLGLGALAVAPPEAPRAAGWRLLSLPLGLMLALGGLFSLLAYSMGHDPVRRLAVVWVAWGFAAGRIWDALPLTPFVPRAVWLVSLALGSYWFRLREFNYFLAADGSRLPRLQWLSWRAEGHPCWWLPPLALAVTALAASAPLWRLLGPRVGRRG